MHGNWSTWRRHGHAPAPRCGIKQASSWKAMIDHGHVARTDDLRDAGLIGDGENFIARTRKADANYGGVSVESGRCLPTARKKNSRERSVRAHARCFPPCLHAPAALGNVTPSKQSEVATDSLSLSLALSLSADDTWSFFINGRLSLSLSLSLSPPLRAESSTFIRCLSINPPPPPPPPR